jgi:hypothetical protein
MDDKAQGKCPFGFGAGGAVSGFSHASVAPAMSRASLPELLKEPVVSGAGGHRTGRCLCGAVSFEIRTTADKVFANHDATSRRWTGGVALTVMVRATNTAFNGWGHVVQYPSSDRERQCFCRLCGTSLFVRHVQPEAMNGMLSISAGCLDGAEGLVLAADTSVDQKPAYYGFEGSRRGLTTAEIDAQFAPRPAAE